METKKYSYQKILFSMIADEIRRIAPAVLGADKSATAYEWLNRHEMRWDDRLGVYVWLFKDVLVTGANSYVGTYSVRGLLSESGIFGISFIEVRE